MNRTSLIALYLVAIFLQAGAYGLTFLLPKLFDSFGANEKVVGGMLFATTLATLLTVYFSGHLSDVFGRLRTLSGACLAISLSLFLFGWIDSVGIGLVIASLLMGFGWGLTYSLGPIVLSRIVSVDDRVRYFTLLSAFNMAGFGLSPVLAASLEEAGHSIRDAFYLTASLCIVSAVLFYLLDQPIKAQAISARPEVPSRITLRALAGVMKSRSALPIGMICLGASVFAGMINFQTVFADARGLDYANFFLIYTLTVVAFRLVLAQFKGGDNPYRTIAFLLSVMGGSVMLFIFSGTSVPLYLIVAVLFGVGYGISYPILVTVAANDAEEELSAQTLQLFALTYFIGIFGFPLIAGWMIVEVGTISLLTFIAGLAFIEASLALHRSMRRTTR